MVAPKEKKRITPVDIGIKPSYVGSINIAVITLNLNNRQPNDKEVLYMRFVNKMKTLRSNSIPDIVVIGAQEVVKYNSLWKYTAMCVANESKEMDSNVDIRLAWMTNFAKKVLTNTFNNVSYIMRGVCAWYGLSIIVLVKKCFGAYIENIRYTSCSTGIGGLYGNKGALGALVEIYLRQCSNEILIGETNNLKIPWKYQKFKIVFINAHLSPYEGNTYKNIRDSQTTYILDNLSFRRMGEGPDSKMQVGDSDIIFFFGDLNYRLNNAKHSKKFSDIARKTLENGEIESLVRMDELKGSIKRHIFLKYFKEPKISFPPTYKKKTFLSHNQTVKCEIESYDLEKRLPAYCDRILVALSVGNGLRNAMSRRCNQSSVSNLCDISTFSSARDISVSRLSRNNEQESKVTALRNVAENSKPCFIQSHMYSSLQNSILSDHDPVIGVFKLKLTNKKQITVPKRTPVNSKMNYMKGVIRAYFSTKNAYE